MWRRLGICWLVIFPSILPMAGKATSLTWDATNTTAGVQEGGGNWTTVATDTNWWSTGTGNVAWNNAAGDIAVFGSNTAQAFSTLFRVTNTVDVTVGGILFNQSYTLGVAGGNQITFNNGSVITNASTNTTLASLAAPLFATGTVYRTGVRINWASTSFNGGGSLIYGVAVNDTFNNSNVFAGLSSIILTNAAPLLDLRGNGTYAGGGTGPVLRIYGSGGVTIQSLGGNGADWHGDIQLLNVANAAMTGSGNNATTPSVFTLSGNISGVGGLALSGQNWGIVLSGSNSYANGTTISAGNVTFANATALPSSGLVTISAGSLVLTGALNGAAAWLSSGKITTNGSWGGIALPASEDVTLGVYSNLFVGAAGVVNYTNTLTPGGAVYRLGGGGGTLLFNQTLAGATSLVVGPTNGVGAVLLSNTANSYTGGTTLNAGYVGGSVPMGNILLLGADNVLGTGRLTLNGGVLASDSAVARTLTNAVTLAGNLQVSQFSAAFGGSNGNITLSGPVNLNAGSRTLNVTNAATTLLLSGVVTNGNVLTKNGVGRLVLANPGNNFTGGVTVNSGTLAFGADNVIGTGPLNLAASVVLASDGAAARSLSNAITVQAGLQFGNTVGTGSLTFSGVVNLGSAAKTLVVSNSTTTLSGPITNAAVLIKSGPGTLVLAGANSTFGGLTNQAGVLALGGDNVFGTGTVVLSTGTLASDGASTRLFSNAVTVFANTTLGQSNGGTGQLILSGPVFNGSVAKTWTVNNPTTLVSGAISGSGMLTKAGTGLLIFSGANNYSGGTIISNGVLQFNSLGAIGGTGANVSNLATVAFDFVDVQSALARLSTVPTGVVALTASSAGSLVDFNSAGLSNAWLGAVGAISYDLASHTPFTAGAYRLGGGGGTLTITNQVTGSASLTIGGIGGGNVLLTANNSYSGGTVVQGTLTLGVDNALPTTGAVSIGSGAASAGLLDLNGHNQTIASLTAGTTGTGVTNLITIGGGQTLTINGGLTVGVDNGAATTTRLTMSGGGALVVTNGAANVLVGLGQAAQSSSSAGFLDLSGLSSVTFGSGSVAINELRVGFGTTSSGTLTLSDTTNTITASAVRIGDSSGANGGTSLMILGVGGNVMVADTLSLGVSKSTGTLKFNSQTAGSPGTVTIGGKTNAASTLLIGYNNGTGTASTPTGLLELRGHTANVTAGTVTVGFVNNNSSGLGGASGTINFDAGLFTARSLTLGTKSGTTFAGAAAAVGTFNISGGTVNIGTGGVTLATSASAGGIANGTLNLLGGTLIMNGNISKGSSTGAGTGTVNIGNATLYAGTNFSVAAPILVNFTGVGGDAVIDTSTNSVTISSVVGGAGGFSKLGAGLLTFAGSNTYNGATAVSNGMLRVTSIGLLNSSTTVYVDNLGAMDFGGNLQAIAGLTGGGLVTNGGGNLILNLVGVTNTFSGVLVGASTFTLTGGGLLNLTGTNSFTGVTLVSNATLAVNGLHNGGVITVISNGFIGGTGPISALLVDRGGTYAPGNGLATQLVASLTLTNAGLIEMELGNNARDQVVVTNSLILADGAQLKLNLAAYSFAMGSTITLVDWTTASTGLNKNDPAQWFTLNDVGGPSNNVVWAQGATLAVLGSGSSNILFQIDYDGLANGQLGTHAINLTMVPEPGTASLLGLVAFVWLARRLRRFARG